MLAQCQIKIKIKISTLVHPLLILLLILKVYLILSSSIQEDSTVDSDTVVKQAALAHGPVLHHNRAQQGIHATLSPYTEKCVCAELAEACMKAVYKQNHVTLELISESMNNIRNAYTEARHACNQFHNLLLVSS